MGIRVPQSQEEDSAQDVPAWMTTFSDCMTLLLTFFVLLFTFSSFDDYAMARLKGAFDYRSHSTVFPGRFAARDSLNEEREVVVDWTEEGSEKPDTISSEQVINPKAHEMIIGIDAYRDEKLFYLNSKQMFFGDGRVLTSQGREILDQIGLFMKMVPCKMIVTEATATGGTREKDLRRRLLRAWSVTRYLKEIQGLPARRMSISITDSKPLQRHQGQSVMKITLLNKDMTK